MSNPPPSPYISPDGKAYWDGRRWVPMQRIAKSGQSPLMILVAVLSRLQALAALGDDYAEESDF
jgi:hypothetical protein